MLRRRSIRLRILVLVIVPVLALVGLYAAILGLTLGNLASLNQTAKVRREITVPIVNVQIQLAKERQLMLAELVKPGPDRLAALLAQENGTSRAIRQYHIAARAALAHGATPRERQVIAEWNTQLASVPTLRHQAFKYRLGVIAAAHGYSAVISGGYNVLTQALLPLLTAPAQAQATSLLTMDNSYQELSEESALVSADLLTHSFPIQDINLVDQLVVLRKELWNQTYPGLNPQFQHYLTKLIPAGAASRLTHMESILLAGPARAKTLSLKQWNSTTTAYSSGFQLALSKSQAALAGSHKSAAASKERQLILLGSLGLLAILVVAGVGVAMARVLVRQLNELRSSAIELSDQRLPDAIGRLRAGEDVDASATVPELEAGSDEIGQVRQAFNTVARTAITAAADEVSIRHGINEVFRNLARRSQSLLARQLQLLDEMERRAQDPDELADLFRVDHLTTRMRRHAEGLLIVAGGTSGRTRHEPVAVVDVMRAAVAEVEDYTRIRVFSHTSAAVSGRAVADIIHLLAEMVENATTYSPSNTQVRIDADRVPLGVAIEIEDRGLGMNEAQLAQLNATLDNPPDFDPTASDQLGLFIVGQLARRHRVKVSLRDSSYGGVIAVVLIPSDLLADIDDSEREYPPSAAHGRAIGSRTVPELPAASPGSAFSIAASILGGVKPDQTPVAGGYVPADPGDPLAAPSTRPAPVANDGPLAPPREPPAPLARRNPKRTDAEPFSSANQRPAEPPTVERAQAASLAEERSEAGPVPPANGRRPEPSAAEGPWAGNGRAQEPSDGRPPEPAKTGFVWNESGIGIAMPEAASTPTADLIDLDGLPMRVRQASLAPQLRREPIVIQPEPVSASEPSPDETRSMFAALQSGWERGRAESEPGADQPGDSHDNNGGSAKNKGDTGS